MLILHTCWDAYNQSGKLQNRRSFHFKTVILLFSHGQYNLPTFILGKGHHTEQYRIYEALESGAIPVIITTPERVEEEIPPHWRFLKPFLPIFSDYRAAIEYLRRASKFPDWRKNRLQAQSIKLYDSLMETSFRTLYKGVEESFHYHSHENE